MSEYIGSRISLVSKSEIRYEGTLVKIDSETATVSLQDVQCHGTEGRKGNANEEIPGSDSVYDGIVFRGSDVKDLTIVAPPKENRPPQQQMPNDPAILSQPEPSAPSHTQHQQPPQSQNQFRGPQPPYGQQQQQQFGYPGPPPNQFQQHPRFQGPGGAHGFPGQPGAVPGYGMGYGPPPPPPGYGNGMGMGYGPPPGHGFPPGPFPPQQQPIGPPGQQMGQPPNGQQQRPPQQMPGQHQQAPIGSKQNTPQPGSSQAPPPSGPAQSKPAEVSEMSTTPAPSSTKTPAGPPPPIESKPSTSAASAPAKANQAPSPAVPKPVNKTSNRVAVPLAMGSPAARQQPKPAVPAQAQQAAQQAAQAPATAPVPQAQPQQPQTKASATEAATAAVAAAMAKLGASNRPSGGVDNLTQKVSQMRVDDGQFRGRGRGRGGSGPRGGRRESAQKNVEVPKEDFDFETANAKFNKRELAKEAIASGSPLGSPTNETFQSAANGHADEEDVVIPAKPSSNEKGYDKKSSFFDNISSDLKDRTEQQQTSEFVDGRAMRREERSKNMETFGQGSVDGGFRGRGRGRGRGFGGRGRGYYGGGRGGFENGDRGGFRGRGGRGQGAETSAAV